MSRRNTFNRSLHDLGAAAWFGGSLMGAVGVNGAAAAVKDPHDRAWVASVGWAKWAPANAVAIGVHLVGGAGILLANRQRAAHQGGVRTNTVTKIVVTGAALATTTYNGVLGIKIAEGSDKHTHGATEPSSQTPPAVAKAQQRQKYLQWATPVLTGILIVLGAQQGEQQRPAEILSGVAATLRRRIKR